MLNEIAQGVLAREPTSFSLVGARLTGKSALLRLLASEQGPLRNAAQMAEKPADFQAERIGVALVDCAWQAADYDPFLAAYELLFAQCQQTTCELNWPSLEAQPTSAHRLWQLARQLKRGDYRIVLLFDNFGRWLATEREPLSLLNSLRLLMSEAALVVATEQPLYDVASNLAEASLWDAFIHRFLGLIEPEAAAQWLADYQEQSAGLTTILPALAEIAGRHPFLLRKLGDSLAEVQQMLAPQHPIGEAQLGLLRLRLAEHARPLFMALWHTLQNPPAHIIPAAVTALLEQLFVAPLPAKQTPREQTITLNWLINQAVVAYRERNGQASYQLFSPLFAEFISSRMAAAPIQSASPFAASRTHTPEAPLYEQLTKMEATLLRYFLNHSQSVVSIEQLLAEVWKRPDSSIRRVQEAIRRLRLQLEQQTPPIGVIENERGRGYRFIPAQQEYGQ